MPVSSESLVLKTSLVLPRVPATEVHQFPVEYRGASKFTLHVFHGGIKKDFEGIVPSALMMLKGDQVIGPEAFNRNVCYIKQPITLSEGNSLSIEHRGKHDSEARDRDYRNKR